MRLLSSFLVLALVLGACSSSRHAKGPGLGGRWELSLFPGSDKTFDEIFTQRRPELVLDAKKGTVTGTTGCNQLSGSFTVINDRLSFGSNIVTTRMACPGYEERTFLDALGRINHYRVNETQLSLLHDSTVVMSFTRKP